ncbi:MAG: 30S ribosomal protein S2, partial [Candidatus Micrarchaeia archaeon]
MVENENPQEQYLEAGVHIGTRVSSKWMKKFVYKFRKDKLVMLNVEMIDSRIKNMAKILSKYDMSKVAVVASRVYAVPAAKKFAEIFGAKPFLGRFIPGSFTNPSNENFFEPQVIFVCDPRVEKQALVEGTFSGALNVGLADTDNSIKNLDYFIPCNNKGKKSVPFVFYLLAKELMKAKGMIKEDSEFKYKPEDFELTSLTAEEKKEVEESEKEAQEKEAKEEAE